ncbi:ArnT family glycosyltransferase [Halorientalis litorea]|uniref:ArnT family glycosyltransferase n=1 Tax=Halorientalis litorea TaxID=2931977 RepID=UPI001FF0E68C|nr:glycosyltransferase family 39 protein [Halorientalis litorea]
MRDRRRRAALVALAALSGIVVFWLAADLFAHYSSNHDEGVYLQQAQLLLDGQLWMQPAIPDAVHPWFFVEDAGRLYPKYTPVPAGMFALGVAVGVPRLSLALVAAGSVALVGLVTEEAFDDRVGLLAAGLFAASPLFLLDSAVFLPYAPTTLLNLLFALGYLRACRADTSTRHRTYAALAGGAVGLAFFARPYTAVLFAAPFVGHALAVLAVDWRRGGGAVLGISRSVLERYALIAGLGLAGVGVSLAYNAVVTGDPLVFPYQAFAPQDGPGFGVRRILGYEREYTPALALRANAEVLWVLLTRWVVAGPVGSLAAGVGLLVAASRAVRAVGVSVPHPDDLGDHGARALLAGLLVSVPVGNVFFWGNLNVLAALDVPDDGLVSLLGPFYHFDLLVPVAAFGAFGVLTVGDWLRSVVANRWSAGTGRAVVAGVLVAVILVAGVAQAAALTGPVERNRAYTDRYEQAYEPFADRTFEDALVFVPTPYGEWLNHPFQSLRNDPELDGPAVYALDRSPGENFAVLDTYDDRTPYRYTYRGAWNPNVEASRDPIVATVEPLQVARGDRHRVTFTVGRVVGAESATVRLASSEVAVQYGVERLPDRNLTVEWTVTPGQARVNESNLRGYSEESVVRFENATDLSLAVTFTQAGGSTVTYRQELTVERTDDAVRVVWPPETTVCRLVADCGREGTYVDGAEGYVGGVSVAENLTTHSP